MDRSDLIKNTDARDAMRDSMLQSDLNINLQAQKEREKKRAKREAKRKAMLSRITSMIKGLGQTKNATAKQLSDLNNAGNKDAGETAKDNSANDSKSAGNTAMAK